MIELCCLLLGEVCPGCDMNFGCKAHPIEGKYMGGLLCYGYSDDCWSAYNKWREDAKKLGTFEETLKIWKASKVSVASQLARNLVVEDAESTSAVKLTSRGIAIWVLYSVTQ